jgi:mannosyltransferase
MEQASPRPEADPVNTRRCSALLHRWWPAVLTGMIMGIIGSVAATRPVLSWDEIATADVARRPVAQIWQLLHHVDGVFGPYYLAMHAWTGMVGDSVLALRLPSILAMAAASGAATELGRRLFDLRTGILAGLPLCLIPNLSRYAAEARPYAFACLFATLSLLLLTRALDRHRIPSWVAYSFGVLGLGMSHLVALTALGAHAVILLRRPRRVWMCWALSVAVPIVLLTPLLWWGAHQRQEQLSWIPPISAGRIYTFPARLTGSPPVAWLLIGLLLGAVLIRRDRRTADLLSAAALPSLAVAAFSTAGPSFWVNRYLLFVLMPAAVVAAAGLTAAVATIRGRPTAALMAGPLAVLAAAAVPGQIGVRAPTVKNGSDYRTVAAIIRHRQIPGDALVYSVGRTMRAGVGYYLRQDNGAPPDVLMQTSAAQHGWLTAVEYPDPARRLARISRIWLVLYGRPHDPLSGRRDLTGLLTGQFRRAGLWTVKKATLALYVRDNQAK